MSAAKKYKLTLYEQKCNFSKNSISLLGYAVKNNVIEPDKDRLDPLIKLPLPRNTAELKRALGLFAHYAKWVHNFSAKIQPLINNSQFPLNENGQRSFKLLKSEIEKAALVAIDDKETLTVETDASEFAVAATLSQKGRPVAFFSRTLSDSERKHAAVEKEACAIVESIRKWRHYLIHRHFLLITDQKSGNGQVEKFNGTLWRTIPLSLRSKILPIENWEQSLKPSLHCVRSLLCTSINATPHEKLFNFPRRTPVGESLPTWLVPGPILLKKFIRSKNDPYVEEVELLHSNPSYSYVRRRNGQESTVSNRHLAPLLISEEDSLSDSTKKTSMELSCKTFGLRMLFGDLRGLGEFHDASMTTYSAKKP
ncbi:uncharacterized protein LOC113232055 [Hyposmocoma kahamanoa]|uniref:uncharacterized protein LOC113232055 n=1 Tax=Hyposmocoma kahamanoa TaxID=1477025 RepID=UPI000E6D803F|nr:uncharacterized protein LOC113232055 [Hyposmocoma kahamanoa]